MTEQLSRGFSTRAIHSEYDPRLFLGSINPPIFLNATYAYESADLHEASIGTGTIYGRTYNPTTRILENRMAELEGGEACVAFASGMGAICSVLLSTLSQGDEIIHHRTVYIGTGRLLSELPRFGITPVPLDLTDPSNLDAAISAKTRVIYFEMPVNPLLEVIDIAAIAAYAGGAGILLVVDATFASSALCRPLRFGADVVLHSATKYLNGHGDLLAGLAIGGSEVMKRVRHGALDHLTGAALHPLAASSVMRGLQTLELRVRQHCSSAQTIAVALENHPAVSWVRYPFLASHPDHHVATRQMKAGGGLVSFALRTGFDGAQRMTNRLRLISRAVSLGDAHSLIVHDGTLMPKDESGLPISHQQGVGVDLVRLSVGLENVEDILADLTQALAEE